MLPATGEHSSRAFFDPSGRVACLSAPSPAGSCCPLHPLTPGGQQADCLKQGTGSTVNTGVDVLFRSPRLTSKRKSTQYHPADSGVPLMGHDGEEGPHTAVVSLDDSAMNVEDISGESVVTHWKLMPVASSSSTRIM